MQTSTIAINGKFHSSVAIRDGSFTKVRIVYLLRKKRIEWFYCSKENGAAAIVLAVE